MNYKYLAISLLLVLVVQVISFLQLQGQFLSEWMKKNTLLVTLLGLPISYLLIKFTKYCALGFDGQIWPGRLIGFGVGVVVFTSMSWLLMREPLSAKTLICLVLAVLILLVQIFWK
jgi:multidrug transporter EmrE-like cation transporter